MRWVEKDASLFVPGDLALPGDTIRVIVNTTFERAGNLSAYGPAHRGCALLEDWPYPFTGSCWRIV